MEQADAKSRRSFGKAIKTLSPEVKEYLLRVITVLDESVRLLQRRDETLHLAVRVALEHPNIARRRRAIAQQQLLCLCVREKQIKHQKSINKKLKNLKFHPVATLWHQIAVLRQRLELDAVPLAVVVEGHQAELVSVLLALRGSE